jgi:MoaA/NifB/PqqE/SkfB family radical SAM enzyme
MMMGRIRKKARSGSRRLREARMFAAAMKSADHPIVAQIIPTRRCNLSCSYCNEYDDGSDPVDTAEMFRRIDKLADLGATIITASGGEPLLHPELPAIIGRVRSHGIMATLITNGYPITRTVVRDLNRAGLDYVQISIDNVTPDAASRKSLSLLDQKLQWLAEEAEFQVSINAVLGDGIGNPADALTIASRARELNFTATVGVIHDHRGQLRPLDEARRRIYKDILRMGTPVFSFAQYGLFQKNLVDGLPNQWHCRAGCRYLYICEEGLVHRCSQQRGIPGTSLASYSRNDLDRESKTVKKCTPFCTVSCVHQTALLDRFRENPKAVLDQIMVSRKELDPSFKPPRLVRLLRRLFLTGRNRKLFVKIALRILKIP